MSKEFFFLWFAESINARKEKQREEGTSQYDLKYVGTSNEPRCFILGRYTVPLPS